MSDGWGGGAFCAKILTESYREFNENTPIKKRHDDQRRIGDAGKLYEVKNGLLNDIKRWCSCLESEAIVRYYIGCRTF